MNGSDEDAALHLALAVHGYLSGRVTEPIDTSVITDRTGGHHLIPGDVDALLEAVIEYGPALAGPGGRPDLVERAQALTDTAASVPVPDMLALLDELGRLARIEWAEFLPLPVADPAVSPAAEPPTDRGPDLT